MSLFGDEELMGSCFDKVRFDLGLFFTLGEPSSDAFTKTPKTMNKKDNFLTCQESGLFLLFVCKDDLDNDAGRFHGLSWLKNG